ncbi:MAG TPA: GYD domain-containing protein [Nitrospiria bacterium]|nr:GYD domain-containing protein [Nitrospiria bacterium]
MSKFIVLMKMTDQGSKDIRNLEERIQSGTKLLEKMGGKLIGFYMVMGEYDYVGIGEAPSDEVQTAFALTLSSLGNVKTTSLRAFSKEEIPAIIKMMPKP